MESMKELQLKNIRSLKDTGLIPISPITLLVGENSSGKSTFLRIFPLLKQSIQKKTNGPILWAGDIDDYVDFGSFEEAVTNDGSKSMCISFSFDVRLDEVLPRYYWSLARFITYDEAIKVKYTIQIDKMGEEEREFVSSLSVELNNTFIQLERLQEADTTISVDNKKVPFTPVSDDSFKETESYFLWRSYSGRSIFGIQMPAIASWVFKGFKDKSKGIKAFEEDRDYNEPALFIIGEALIHELSLKDIRATFCKNDSETKKNSKRGIATPIRKQVGILLDWIDSLPEDEKQNQIRNIKLLYFYLNYFAIEEYIRVYFSQVHYMAPIRATAERYYRLRNSAIDEVDHQGKNLAIFLNSLPETRLTQFQDWTAKHFGFRSSVSRTEGHLSIEINRIGHDERINLSDTGFGYSQILPIITQLWELSSRKVNSKNDGQIVPLVVAIEQPELHLHPAMQARLAESFIACVDLAKDNGYSLQLLLETHSETMINYFGRAIAKRKIASNDITVVLFERDEKTNQSIATISNYDSDGFLTNWPIGFFAPED